MNKLWELSEEDEGGGVKKLEKRIKKVYRPLKNWEKCVNVSSDETIMCVII